MSEAVVQSVLDRLLNLSRKNREDYNLVLTRYGIERLLYRLSQNFILHKFSDLIFCFPDRQPKNSL